VCRRAHEVALKRDPAGRRSRSVPGRVTIYRDLERLPSPASKNQWPKVNDKPAPRSNDRTWGGRRDSNPQQPEPQSGALPLNYGHHISGPPPPRVWRTRDSKGNSSSTPAKQILAHLPGGTIEIDGLLSALLTGVLETGCVFPRKTPVMDYDCTLISSRTCTD
jgi:hypothetical protein